jgi:hypothetical protein
MMPARQPPPNAGNVPLLPHPPPTIEKPCPKVNVCHDAISLRLYHSLTSYLPGLQRSGAKPSADDLSNARAYLHTVVDRHC